MKRGLILVGMWALGAAVALTLAFAAVGRVANGVAPRDVARLSSTQIDDELTGPAIPAITSSGTRGPGTTGRTATSGPKTTSSSSSSTTTSTTRPPGSTIVDPTTGSTATTTTTTPHIAPPTTATVPPTASHNTATTSQGGIVFTRCSGPEKIVYVAAVPRSGYERTVDVENEGSIQQVFVNAHHSSKIEAECSRGVVHAQVEEESTDD